MKDDQQVLIVGFKGVKNPLDPSDMEETEEITLERIKNPINNEELSDCLLQLFENTEREWLKTMMERSDEEIYHSLIKEYDELASRCEIIYLSELSLNDKLEGKIYIPIDDEKINKLKSGTGSSSINHQGLVEIKELTNWEKVKEETDKAKMMEKDPHEVKKTIDEQRKSDTKHMDDHLKIENNEFKDLAEDLIFLINNRYIDPTKDGKLAIYSDLDWRHVILYIKELAEIGDLDPSLGENESFIEEAKNTGFNKPIDPVIQLDNGRLFLSSS